MFRCFIYYLHFAVVVVLQQVGPGLWQDLSFEADFVAVD